MYPHYQKARNKAWEVLLHCKIGSLPIDLGEIADAYDLKVSIYSETTLVQLFRKDVLQGDGFIINNKSEKQIFINDGIKSRNRRRFTLAHELGHGTGWENSPPSLNSKSALFLLFMCYTSVGSL